MINAAAGVLTASVCGSFKNPVGLSLIRLLLEAVVVFL